MGERILPDFSFFIRSSGQDDCRSEEQGRTAAGADLFNYGVLEKCAGECRDVPLATQVQYVPAADRPAAPVLCEEQVVSAGGKLIRHGSRISEAAAADLVIFRAGLCRLDQLLHCFDWKNCSYRRLTEAQLDTVTMKVLGPVLGDWCSVDFLNRVGKLVRRHPRLEENTPSDRERIALSNGLLHLPTGEFTRQKGPAWPVTANLQAEYVELDSVVCPVFDRFLEDVTGGDTLLTERIWQAIGYLLVPDPKARALILFQGLSGTGKSVLCDLVEGCFFREDVSTADVTELTKPAALKNIVGKRLLVNGEMADAPLSPRVVKTLKGLTGGDLLHADHPDMRRQTIEFQNSAKVLLCTNYSLQVLHLDESLCSRIVVIPFKNKPTHCDCELKEKLAGERNEIVTKALQHYRQLAANDYLFSGDFFLDDVVEWPQQPEASVVQFLKEECRAVPDGWVSTDSLYSRFCELYGDICTIKMFSVLMNTACRRCGYRVEKERERPDGGANPLWGFRGIALR